MRHFVTVAAAFLACASCAVAEGDVKIRALRRSYGPYVPPPPAYKSCGGFTATPNTCDEGYICIDDPSSGGCGLACDEPGICVKPVFCGGFANIKCAGGLKCIDDPRDDCFPPDGGADCGGICV